VRPSRRITKRARSGHSVWAGTRRLWPGSTARARRAGNVIPPKWRAHDARSARPSTATTDGQGRRVRRRILWRARPFHSASAESTPTHTHSCCTALKTAKTAIMTMTAQRNRSWRLTDCSVHSRRNPVRPSSSSSRSQPRQSRNPTAARVPSAVLCSLPVPPASPGTGH
jgi:hypothetical protein